MSKSRAKKKQRQRTRAATGEERGGHERRETAARPTHNRAPRGGSPAAARRASRLEIRDGVPRPDAIWAPFPLTELGMAVGLALFVIGFAADAAAYLLAGVGVLTVVVGELCVREHFAGFRSHTILLALLPVTAVHVAVVVAASVDWRGPVALAVDLAIAGALAWWLRGRFAVARTAAQRS